MKKNNLLKKVTVTAMILTALSLTACGNDVKQEERPDEKAEENIAGNIGQFTAQDIYSKEITQAIFADYDLTLVNLFATWCGPCIQEMPELAQIHKDMRNDGVNIIAVVLDSVSDGKIDEDVVDTTKELSDMIEAEFTFMIPDETNLNGRLDGISAVPESFFVDSEGNMVGEPIVGARSYDDWKVIIEDALEQY